MTWHLISAGQTIDISILKFKDEYKGDEPEWSTCNKDSLFYKLDTLTFTTGINKCCQNFSFKIRGKKIKQINWNNMCVEPPTEMTISNIKKGKVAKHSNKYYLKIYRSHKIWTKFEITELKKISYFDTANYPRHYFLMKVKRLAN